MSEEELEPMPAVLQGLIERDRARTDLPAGARDRLAARLAPAFVAAPAPATPPAAPPSSLLGAAGKGALILALGAGLGAGGHALLAKSEPPKIVYVDRPVLVAPSAIAAPMATAAEVLPVPSAVPHPAPRASSSTARGRDTDLGAERVLIEIARTALSRNDAPATLDAVAKYDGTYPRGQLREEADAIEVQALVLAGRTAEAKRKGAQFRLRYPSGISLPIVDQALSTIP